MPETLKIEETVEEVKPTIQEIVNRYLPGVEWTSSVQGRCPCPGKHKHTSRSHRNDCWVFVNGTPTVTCLHESCKDEVAEANSKIRSAWNLFQPEIDPAELAAAKEKAAKRHALEEKAAASLPEILKQFRWDYDEIDGGHQLGRASYYCFTNALFGHEDIIWCGEPSDSGTPGHATHFSKRKDWDMAVSLYGVQMHYTCASTFKPGSYSRANANVAETKYLIVEGDKLIGREPKTDEEKLENKNRCGAIFNWLRRGCDLSLRAVVDSGNKSLHGWFAYPSSERLDELKIVLPAMGCDRAMFKPTQPARLPGITRDNGNEQKLLWIQ